MLSNISTISSKSIKYVFEQYTILHQAIFHVNTEIVDVLSKKQNIDINIIYNYSVISGCECTALNIATKNNYSEIVKILLSNPDIDVNTQYKSMYYREMNSTLVLLSMVLIFISSKPFSLLMAMMLVDLIMANRNIILKSFLFSSIIGAIIFFMLKYFLPSNIFDSICALTVKTYLFIVSIPYSHILSVIEKVNVVYSLSELLLSLLYTRYIIKFPLHFAIENKNVENAKLLLSNEKIDINLVYKSFYYNYKDNSYFLKMYEEIYTNKTALNFAVEQNNVEIVKLILANANVDINAQYISTSYKRISLIKDTSVMLYTIEFLICQLYSSHSEKSSLSIAVENNYVEIVKQLLEKSQNGFVINE